MRVSRVIWNGQRVVDASWVDLDKSIENLLITEPLHIRKARENNIRHNLRDIAVTPAQGALLRNLVQMSKPRDVLEIGTLGAYSTLWMAEGLQQGGNIVSIEVDPTCVVVARQNTSHDHRIRIVQGDAADILPNLKDSSVDFVFIDANKSRNVLYCSHAFRLLRSRGTLVIDNVVRHYDHRLIQLVHQEMQKQNNAAQATVIQTVGTKGWDGFLLYQKN